jgi:hypothetical protein
MGIRKRPGLQQDQFWRWNNTQNIKGFGDEGKIHKMFLFI